MKTKTLLIAAAALAVGVISSQAQVYSQNIVGYANVKMIGGNNYNLVVAPLRNSTNTPESLITGMNIGDNVFVWTPGVGYTIYNYAGVDGAGAGLNWYDPDFNGVASPVIAAGQAIFYQNSGATYTNVFVGDVQLTNSPTLAGGNNYNLIGTTPPIGGFIDSTNFNMNFNVGDNVFVWTPGVGYTIYNYAGVDGAGAGLNWYDPDFNGVVGPVISVGQGYFYQNSGPARTWTNNITVQ
jgi:hypothetical protein